MFLGVCAFHKLWMRGPVCNFDLDSHACPSNMRNIEILEIGAEWLALIHCSLVSHPLRNLRRTSTCSITLSHSVSAGCVALLHSSTECTKIAHRRSLAIFTADEGIAGNSAARTIFTHLLRRRDRGSLAIFLAEETAHLGASKKSRDFSGSGKNRRRSRRESHDFGALSSSGIKMRVSQLHSCEKAGSVVSGAPHCSVAATLHRSALHSATKLCSCSASCFLSYSFHLVLMETVVEVAAGALTVQPPRVRDRGRHCTPPPPRGSITTKSRTKYLYASCPISAT